MQTIVRSPPTTSWWAHAVFACILFGLAIFIVLFALFVPQAWFPNSAYRKRQGLMV
jgi:hypothetical protein